MPDSEQRPTFLYFPSVEDRAELSGALAHIGGAVPSDYDGDRGVQLHQAPQAGLIIVDIDGDAAWTATRRALKMRAPKVPVVVCSRLAAPPSVGRCAGVSLWSLRKFRPSGAAPCSKPRGGLGWRLHLLAPPDRCPSGCVPPGQPQSGTVPGDPRLNFFIL